MVHRVLLHLTCFRLAINASKNTNPSKGSAKNLLIISGNVFVIRSGTIHVLVQQFLIDLLLLSQKVLNVSVTSYHMILRPSHLLALWSPSHWQSPPPGPRAAGAKAEDKHKTYKTFIEIHSHALRSRVFPLLWGSSLAQGCRMIFSSPTVHTQEVLIAMMY